MIDRRSRMLEGLELRRGRPSRRRGGVHACMQTVFTRIAACAAGAGPGSLGSESVSPLAVSLKEDGLL